MAWVRRDLKEHPVPPAMGKDTFLWTTLLRVPLSLALNTSRDGEPATSLRNRMFQCLTSLTVMNLFLVSNLNLDSFSLNKSSLVLSLSALEICKVIEFQSSYPIQFSSPVYFLLAL